MKQLLLGKQRRDDIRKCLTGNPMVISQAQATPEQDLPTVKNNGVTLVVLFRDSADNTRNSVALVSDREPYQRCLQLSHQVCPVFAEVGIDSHGIVKQVPKHGVPAAFVKRAQPTPEAKHFKTTMDGSANTRNTFSTSLADNGSMAHDEPKAPGKPRSAATFHRPLNSC